MRFYWESYGCAASTADMERILGIVKGLGHSETRNPEDADFIILNTCAVKLTTENRMITRFKRLADYGKPIVVTGCLPRMNFDRFKRECTGFAAAMDPSTIDRIGEVIRRVLSGEREIVVFGDKWRFDLPCQDLHPVIHIVPISNGCLGNCAFCGVKNVRGKLQSVEPELIISDIKRALVAGKKEIWLTSQDNGVYGWDIGTDLNELLEMIVKIDAKFRLRIGMMNPHGAKSLLPDILEYYSDPRIYSFAHIPVQSGSDRVLRAMKRQHTVKDFIDVVNELREIDDMAISTDVIVGFPGETEEDFGMTVSLIEETRPDIVNISKFYPRPNTEAAKMKKVKTQVISDRTRRLAKLVDEISLERNKRMVGREFEALVSDRGRRANLIARAPNYKQVIVSGVELGDFCTVRVVSASKHSLFGEVK